MIKKKLVKRTTTLLIAAFGFVGALAWNEAVKLTFQHFFENPTGSILAAFIYAILVTIVAVIITIRFEKYTE